MTTIAERLFDNSRAENELEDMLCEAGVEFERLGWDSYDVSLEIHGVPPESRLSDDIQRMIHGAGFGKVYVNHTDKWETHYSWPLGEFIPVKGWRVSYPHKRGEGESGIWVEEQVSGWPKEWFESGYCRVTKLRTA
jgi:hypothetical protein